MNTCPSCGTSVEQGAGACPKCGLKLAGTTQSFQPVSAEAAEAIAEYGDAGGPVLVVRKGPEIGERFYIEGARMSIGRDPASDVFLNDVTVSRKHALVERVGDHVSVRDSGSLNGTYVNGVCVDKADLSSGDTLQIGMFQMVFLAGPKGA